MERERGNPTYSFLFDLQSPLHHYYRWRVFSFAQGDTLTRWRVDPFVMVQGGPRWLPPPLPEDSSDKKQEPPTAAGGKGKVRPQQGSGEKRGRVWGRTRTKRDRPYRIICRFFGDPGIARRRWVFDQEHLKWPPAVC